MKNKAAIFVFLLFNLYISNAQVPAVSFTLKSVKTKMGLVIFRNSKDIESDMSPISLQVNTARKLRIPCPLLFFTANKNLVPIYVIPGDSIIITKTNDILQFNVNNHDLLRDNDQRLLLELLKQYGPLYESGKPEELFKGKNKEEYIKEVYKKRVSLIDTYLKKTQISPYFEYFLKNYIFYLQITQVIREENMKGVKPASILMELLKEFPSINWGKTKDSSLFQIDTYTSFINSVAILQSKITPSVSHRMRNLLLYFDGPSRDYALFQEIKKLISNGGDSSQTCFDIFYQNCTNGKYIEIVKEEKRLMEDVSRASMNDLLMQVRTQTISLNSLLSNQYRGKIVVIDFWASWCIPCINQFPFFDKLIARFKGDTSVVFTFFSMDKKRKEWVDVSSKYKFLTEENNYLLVNDFKANFSTHYKIHSIPRTIVMYQNKIYSLDAPRPSDGSNLEDLIKNLQKKGSI